MRSTCHCQTLAEDGRGLFNNIVLMTLNKVFRSRTGAGHWLLIVIIAIAALWASWERQGIVFGICLLLLVLFIERIIHSSYIVSNCGTITIHKGRLIKDKKINVKDIKRIDGVGRNGLARLLMQRSLVLVMNNNEEIFITPADEEGFINYVCKIRDKNAKQSSSLNQ